MKADRLYALIILDGFGLRDQEQSNAVKISKTPNICRLMEQYPFAKLGASGLDVGLPDGQIGNSEVGHLNIGAGRTVYQDITMIDKSIKDGDFFVNPAFLTAMDNCLKNDSKLHLVGLLSDGGVHSTINHLFALLKLAKQKGLKKVFVHCLLDGRDVPPASGADFVARLEDFMKKEGIGRVASVMGRYYFMDRDNRWERVEKGFNCMFAGAGQHSENAVDAIKQSYKNEIYDEFVLPVAIVQDQKPVGEVDNNDSIIFFNFRSDRAREVSRAILERDFDMFQRKKGFLNLCYVGFTQYDASFEGMHIAYPPKDLKNTFGQYVASLGYKQLRIAETEKYAHVTFFFNGGVEAPNQNENRVLIASPKVATYDQKPEMSAYEVCQKALEQIEKGDLDIMVLNFANCDMVGHTGDLEAAVRACAVVDECTGKLVDQILKMGGAAIIVADHGNAELMAMPDGTPWTAHTTNPVPFILADDKNKNTKLKSGGVLADIIPTMFDIMGIEKPAEMEGKSLIIKD